MSRDREVQLAPSSMALTLCRLAEEKGSRGDEEEGGRRLFRDFQTANANCFWNKRLVRAVSEVSFQGWLESWVLLVQGAQTSLEVLRDAWVRRALRPPRGFTITALGDVTPVQMSPVSQSQFIPLAEVLCCAISDMNASQILVTQESLLEHLVKHYPGIATPSQEILYNTLGTLIKERKIYHTGEGYFIVTPQTYFITKKPASDNKCQTGDIGSPTPLSITYLVSMESCADLTKGNPLPSVSHCRSCSCFSDHSAHNILGQQSINESNDKSLRAIKESRAPVQNQATSTCRDQYKCGKAKPQLALKEKDKCTKKFGISLFWRNVSKKEKPKKELSTFSAQFPPEEWPVRDEDNLDNIPRDIEHEIIKRINPVLTVDNLMKHTMMMQKAEEQQKYFSKGTSTDIIKNKTGPAIKGFCKKKNRLSKYHRKLQSSKEKNKDLCASKTEELAKKEVTNTASNVMTSDGTYTVCADVISHNIVYKKQISNPFEGVSYRGNLSTNGHKALKEIKRNNSGKQRRNRARSLDSAEKKADDRTKYLHSERLAGIFNTEESIHKQILPFTQDKDDLRGYPANYPQCSTLRIDDKFKLIKESGPMVGFHNEERNPSLGNLQNKSLVRTEDVSEHSGTIAQPKGTGGSQVSNGILQQKPPIHCKGATSSNRPCTIVPNSRTEFYKLGNYCGIFKEHSQYAGFTRSPCKELADDQASFQNLAHGDNACSSLYFDDNTNENISTCQALEKTINGNAVNWKSLHEEDIASETIQWNPYNYRPSGFSSDSSQGYHDPPTLSEDCSDQQKYIHSHSDVASDKDKLVHSPAVVDGSIFDYCNSSEGNSMAETVQTSGNGNCEKHVASGQPSEEPRKCFEHKVKLFNTKGIQLETNQHERNENQSTTGDSGIESPRTRISLASNNSLVLEKLKRRMFLQNLEINGNSKSEGLLSVSSLMQLTPAVNV